MIVTNELLAQSIDHYEYEAALTLPDSETRYPDFTIVDGWTWSSLFDAHETAQTRNFCPPYVRPMRQSSLFGSSVSPIRRHKDAPNPSVIPSSPCSTAGPGSRTAVLPGPLPLSSTVAPRDPGS